MREPYASLGQITMIFGVQHARNNGAAPGFHQLQTIARVYISLTSELAAKLAQQAIPVGYIYVPALLKFGQVRSSYAGNWVMTE